tara:strand:+ start:306 stop:689 length:384 start_codon:yes stop_codon:yes gene_type:complete
MPPLLHPALINRLPHLLGARRPHWPFVLEKPEAALLKREATVLKHRADLSFCVIDQTFVNDTLNAIRQNLVVVAHQVDIVSIEVSNILKGVAKALTPGEVLFKVGKATRYRMTPGVDDAGIGQADLN